MEAKLAIQLEVFDMVVTAVQDRREAGKSLPKQQQAASTLP
ncbi:hypothetical protein KR51_00001980 [Rubidibacter lacunae KORDI 51-2]|uniref:Uncharacterized protein n=1 Tax=Rubidibacter lacunae KORDI 51-2 TaxID=582515 RepID=U5DPV6_9CHRO|nr:hypothetical protein [Rubidibacter lacunae]ERN42902.1 hypothetical protein KR51_00001980 [Rubidibacter lacunae KORDI 51-2]